MAGPGELRIKLDRPAYVYPMFEQALRIAAGESPDVHRRRIGELWAQFSAVAADNPHAWNREPSFRRSDLAARPVQSDDQLALHQADELEQHGRSGRGADPDVGGEGAVPSDPVRPLGLPVRGHRRARHLRDQRARRVRRVARDQDRRSPRARARGHRRRRRRTRRRLLVLPVGRPGGGARARAPARRSEPPADGHRWPDLRGRAVEQLRHRTRSPRWPSGWWPRPVGSASSPPTAATSPSTVSASTAPSRLRTNSVGKTSNRRSTPSPPAPSRWSGPGPARWRRGRHRSTGTGPPRRPSLPCGHPTTPARWRCSPTRRRPSRARARTSRARRSRSTPTARPALR